jgi:hypothetical protein
MTRTEKLIAALERGEELTVDQIRARYRLQNPTATVSKLRTAGYYVYANRRRTAYGVESTKYRLGTPPRSVVAAGVVALRQAS